MEDIPLLVALVDKLATEMSLVETPVFEVPPATEVAVPEPITPIEHVFLETLQGEVAELEVNITISTSIGKNHSVLNLAHIFSIFVGKPKNFCRSSYRSCSSSNVSARTRGGSNSTSN